MEAGVVPPRPGLLVRDLDFPSGLSFRYFGRPKTYALFIAFVRWAKPLLGSRSMRDPGFLNPTAVVEEMSLVFRISKSNAIHEVFEFIIRYYSNRN